MLEVIGRAFIGQLKLTTKHQTNKYSVSDFNENFSVHMICFILCMLGPFFYFILIQKNVTDWMVWTLMLFLEPLGGSRESFNALCLWGSWASE